MESKEIPMTNSCSLTDDQCQKSSFYVSFTDDDVDELMQYAFDMGYILQPDANDGEHRNPGRFKITSQKIPAVYGWISKVQEFVNGEWQGSYIYGFYRRNHFFNKYPITFNINSRQMRGKMKRDALKNPQQTTYFRTIFGILNLEPQIDPINFVLSWISSCKFQNACQ